MEIVSFIFIFALKNRFYIKLKTRDTITLINGLDLDKYYLRHDPEQHSYIQEVVVVGHLG